MPLDSDSRTEAWSFRAPAGPQGDTNSLVTVSKNDLDISDTDDRAVIRDQKNLNKKLPLYGMRILLVEDNDNTAIMIKQMLIFAGAFEVAVANNGFDAKYILSGFRPHIIVTDSNMPVEDGISLTLSVRQAALEPSARVPDPTIPIVLVSGNTAATAVSNAQAAGIDAFVAKPFSFDSLVKRVRHASKRNVIFVVNTSYVGPDRRRRSGHGARRATDEDAHQPTTPMVNPLVEASPSPLETLYGRILKLESGMDA